MVEEKATKCTYAMKVIKKDQANYSEDEEDEDDDSLWVNI